MPYILPRVEVLQEFTQVPIFSTSPLNALIVGPQYQLFRYAIASEKSAVNNPDGINGKKYISGSDVTYDYPGTRPVTSVVDQSYIKVYFDNALAQYFPNTALGSASNSATKVTSHTNQLQMGIALKTTGYSDRNAVFSNRDVQVGDYAQITGTVSSVPTVITSRITKVLQSYSSAVQGTVTFDSGNSTAGKLSSMKPHYVSAATDYTGIIDITYKITVTKTGPWYNGSNSATCARIKITSSDVDSSPEIVVAWESAFNVGTKGIVAQYGNVITATTTTTTQIPAASGLTLGDIWYLPITAAAPADANIFEVVDSLGSDVLDAGGITVAFLLKKSGVKIPRIANVITQDENWTPTADDITINAAIQITDSLLVSGSTPVGLDIITDTADIYVEYRALLQENAVSIGSIADPATVATILGPVTPDNPLAEGVYDAALNSAGVSVYYVGVASDDLAGYNGALAIAKQQRVHGLVPLTFDTTVQDAFVGHVNAMSTSTEAKWRITWLSRPVVETGLVLDLQDDDTAWTAKTYDDPLESSTQYTLVRVSGNTSPNLYDTVRVGDTLLINFYTDSDGNVQVGDTRTIVEVRSQTDVIVDSSLGQITSPVKVQIQRNYTRDEQAENLALSGSGYDNRRVRMVFPDFAYTGGVKKNGYFIAAALAGLRSGVVPHQGLTNIELLGFDDLSRTFIDFTQDQLNVLAEQGYWIVTQATIGATAYTRHQLTTDASGLNFSEDSITTNVDSISYGLQAALSPYIGVYNINPTNVLLIKKAVDGELRFRKLNTFTVRAGNQLNDYVIDSVAADTTFKDRINVQVTLSVPYPMNVIKISLIV